MTREEKEKIIAECRQKTFDYLLNGKPIKKVLFLDAVKNILNNISETEYISDDNSESESEIEPTERMDVLKFIADNAGLSLPEAIELAYVKGYNNAKAEARPKGKWIKQTLSVKPFGEDTVLCDKCAFMTDKDNSYNFCPNCGADMRGESEEEEEQDD